MPTPENWHPEDMKAALRKRYGSVVAFERARGLPERSSTDVFRGKSVRRTAEAIAEELSTPVHLLFPGRFQSTNADNSGETPMPHRLNAGVR